ncbi:S-layer homology domain-containing protein, partial [Desulforamulus aeronauticus]
YEGVKKTVSAGVFNGKTKATIDPKGMLTYAEAATAIRNLLTETKMINK